MGGCARRFLGAAGRSSLDEGGGGVGVDPVRSPHPTMPADFTCWSRSYPTRLLFGLIFMVLASPRTRSLIAICIIWGHINGLLVAGSRYVEAAELDVMAVAPLDLLDWRYTINTRHPPTCIELEPLTICGLCDVVNAIVGLVCCIIADFPNHLIIGAFYVRLSPCSVCRLSVHAYICCGLLQRFAFCGHDFENFTHFGTYACGFGYYVPYRGGCALILCIACVVVADCVVGFRGRAGFAHWS